MHRLHLILAASALALVGCAASEVGTQPDTVQVQFARFDRVEHRIEASNPSTRVFVERFRSAYAQIFPPLTHQRIASLDGPDLALLFRAAYVTQFYTHDPMYIRDMQRLLGELQGRRATEESQYQHLYDALVGARLFSQAITLSAKHPEISTIVLPKFRDVSDQGRSGPTDMTVSSDGRELVRHNVTVDAPSQIVVVSSPMCHFSQRAIRDIEADPVLRPLFRDRATWLVPPDINTPFETMAEWNRAHPDELMNAAYRIQEWPLLDRWETPTFYFIKRGALVAQVVGWPREGRKAQILAGLERLGLL